MCAFASRWQPFAKWRPSRTLVAARKHGWQVSESEAPTAVEEKPKGQLKHSVASVAFTNHAAGQLGQASWAGEDWKVPSEQPLHSVLASLLL